MRVEDPGDLCRHSIGDNGSADIPLSDLEIQVVWAGRSGKTLREDSTPRVCVNKHLFHRLNGCYNFSIRYFVYADKSMAISSQ